MHALRRRRGAHAIEFALTLPIWFLLVVAIADFGWLFFHYAGLDAAANLGCRAGSLVDPGDFDERIVAVEDRATQRMLEVLALVGTDDCTSCQVSAFTVGRPPRRSLVCNATRDLSPLVGLFYGDLTVHTRQVARLEWQREAAE